MDLQERRQLDVAGRMQKVRAKTRPWRSMFALLLAIAGAIAVVAANGMGVENYHNAVTKIGVDHTAKIIFLAGTLAFFIFGMIAVFGLSGAVRRALQPLVGQAHAGIVRYVVLVAGVFAIFTVALALLGISPRQLLVGGAVAGVLLGIAAQQSL